MGKPMVRGERKVTDELLARKWMKRTKGNPIVPENGLSKVGRKLKRRASKARRRELEDEILKETEEQL